ncbi:uncharacterized protein LOC143922475 [Arctopsyche grandis]|uniref:uncharacterized protein LOC143922475 n=1 Tax=Arctopsyche grandis TaxID=121162 RepID=UPI00406D7E05
MIKPVMSTARALTRVVLIRHYGLQCCGSSILQKKSKFINVFTRQFHHPTEKNVVASNYPDIVLPNCTITDFIWKDLDRWADKTAVVCGITGRGYTYAQAHKMSTTFAASLRNKLKLREDDCVAVMLPNCPEFPLAALGSLHAGCIVTTVNPIYKSEEVSRQLKNSKAKAIVTTKECYPEVKKAIEELKQSITIILIDSDDLPEGAIKFAEFVENFNEDTDCLRNIKRTINDTVFLPYSSGTTGLPKGVELTNKNIIANCMQMQSGKITIVHPTTDTYQDVSLCVLPFFHIYGLVVTLLSKLSMGVKVVTLPKFSPDTFLNAQAKYKGNVLFVVPPIVLFLSSHRNVTHEHLDPIKTIMSGAAPLAASDVARFLKKTRTNVAFMQGYGMTETSPVVLMQERGTVNYASVGSPTPNTDAKIVDLEDENNVLGPNKVGELWVRGPQIMKGYYENPKANEDIFRPGGWMRTGDMAYYDENDAFYITDRLKELIKVKGYQVAPAELEAILRTHPELSDAAVIGIPHQYHGEVPKAFVVKKKGKSPTAESIMEFVESKVASYKKLGELMFVESIPKSAAGKILRREVKARFT